MSGSPRTMPELTRKGSHTRSGPIHEFTSSPFHEGSCQTRISVCRVTRTYVVQHTGHGLLQAIPIPTRLQLIIFHPVSEERVDEACNITYVQ